MRNAGTTNIEKPVLMPSGGMIRLRSETGRRDSRTRHARIASVPMSAAPKEAMGKFHYSAPIVTLVTASPFAAPMLSFDGSSEFPPARSAVMRNCLLWPWEPFAICAPISGSSVAMRLTAAMLS